MKEEALFACLLLTVFLLFILKSILCLRFFYHFKKCSIYTQTGRVFFMVLYITNLLLTIFAGIASVVDIANANIESKTYDVERMLDVSLIIMTLCGVYFIFMDIVLLKAIRKQYYEHIDNIGLNSNAQP
jgi:hypothetical protein